MATLSACISVDASVNAENGYDALLGVGWTGINFKIDLTVRITATSN